MSTTTTSAFTVGGVRGHSSLSSRTMGFGLSSFAALTGHHQPFRWQQHLYEKLSRGCCPPQINLPTGLGKTSLMQLWLLALAEQAGRGDEKVQLPRRLVWVVDRRVVVDQATEEAEQIRKKLLTSPELQEVHRALSALSGDEGEPLAVSTLRGERADNRQWSDNPARPAIIVGTIDMIGSRLLFSGYGVSRRMRARQAGLLAHDTLLVNDEAHLTPVFAKLADEVRCYVQANAVGRPPLHIVRLSATPRDEAGQAFPEDLAEDEAASEPFRKRYNAPKRLELVTFDDSKKIEKLAIRSTGRTIVFVRSPENARKIALAIRKAHKLGDGDVPLLTGEQRGKERDELIHAEPFKRFTDNAERKGDCWLVATSAGEVGVNISCDRLITELDTADHLLQRFGRLNRFGETEGTATVVVSKKVSDAERATRRYLESLDGNVSPRALRERAPDRECLSQEPNRASLQPWLIDVWSMTSFAEKDWPSRPEVGPWLRGDDKDGPPETYVCWREDVLDLAQPAIPSADLEEVFHCFPVLAKERLKQVSGRLCDALQKSPHVKKRALLVGRDRQVTADTIEGLIDSSRRAQLYYATLILPPGVGRLDHNGAVDWDRSVEVGQEGWERYDVSAVEGGERRRYKKHIESHEGTGEPPDGVRARYKVNLPSQDERENQPAWHYYTALRAINPLVEQHLDEHTRIVRETAATLAERLFGKGSRLVEVLCWVADRHDFGKDCFAWQRYARNTDGEAPLAKASAYLGPATLGGYRHELGSLIAALSDLSGDLSADERDIALHLIAAHHGFARPHFRENAMDKRQVRKSREVSLDTVRRFSRLQRRYGPWGLAYLEALFCAADAMASQESLENPANA